MWTLEAALEIIRELQPDIRALNYHICLGGGVLNTGASEKDLDLFFLPLNGFESEPRKIVDHLWVLFGHLDAIRDHPDYQAGDPWHLRELLKATYCGKRIDLFIQ